MTEERFYLLEHSGWVTPMVGHTRGHIPTEVMILDRLYNHRVLWSRVSGGGVTGYGNQHGVRHGRLEDLRREANRLCDQWNRADQMGWAA